MRVRFAFGGEAEGDGHYFCFAEEESGGIIFVRLSFSADEEGKWAKEGEAERSTCYPITASARL